MSGSVHVIGGGLAGLTASLYAAREGAAVTLYERASEPGGRARTRDEGGYRFNMGPHALYRGGEAAEVLAELGVAPEGAPPPLSGAAARFRGALHALPSGFVSLLTTGLLRLPEKLEAARFLGSLPRLDTARYDDRSLGEVLAAEVKHERVRSLLAALVRLSTYAHAPDVQSAGAALAQVQRAFRAGVLYLHGGWGRLVEALRERAVAAGVEIRTGVPIRAVAVRDRALMLTQGRGESGDASAGAVVLAVPPAECVRILEDAGAAGRTMAAQAEALVPVRAASLELALSSLPAADAGFALGIDEPTYFSVHSNVARVAPRGGALIHCARYVGVDESPARDVLAKELEAIVDQMQPGWRERVVQQKLLTDLTVSHAVVRRGGLRTRPPVALSRDAGLFLAGDWVGSAGMLADAAFASGRTAGMAAARAARGRGVA